MRRHNFGKDNRKSLLARREAAQLRRSVQRHGRKAVGTLPKRGLHFPLRGIESNTSKHGTKQSGRTARTNKHHHCTFLSLPNNRRHGYQLSPTQKHASAFGRCNDWKQMEESLRSRIGKRLSFSLIRRCLSVFQRRKIIIKLHKKSNAVLTKPNAVSVK